MDERDWPSAVHVFGLVVPALHCTRVRVHPACSPQHNTCSQMGRHSARAPGNHFKQCRVPRACWPRYVRSSIDLVKAHRRRMYIQSLPYTWGLSHEHAPLSYSEWSLPSAVACGGWPWDSMKSQGRQGRGGRCLQTLELGSAAAPHLLLH